MTDEKADLDNLLKAPGWLRLLEHARHEWVVGYPAKVKLAIQQARADGTDVASAVASVDAAADAINALVSWPGERVKFLQKQIERPVSLARGGYDPSTAR